MNKLKIIVLIICTMFILSGCTVRGEVTLNPDGTVEESVSVLANTRIFESDAYSKEQLIDNAISSMLASIGDSYTTYSDIDSTNDFLSGIIAFHYSEIILCELRSSTEVIVRRNNDTFRRRTTTIISNKH